MVPFRHAIVSIGLSIIMWSYPVSSGFFKVNFHHLPASNMTQTLRTKPSPSLPPIPCDLDCKWPKYCTIFMNKAMCRDTCSPKRCRFTEYCAELACKSKDCPDKVFCIPKATLPPEVTLPPTGVMCGKGNSTTFCKNFQECIDDGDHQYCADYCAPDKCPPTMNCRLDIVNCIKEPCPPIAVCV